MPMCETQYKVESMWNVFGFTDGVSRGRLALNHVSINERHLDEVGDEQNVDASDS